MQSILHIIKMFKDGLLESNPRFDHDREHVKDTLTDVKLHLYDDGFKVTKDDEIMYTSNEAGTADFKDENQMLQYIHRMLKQHYDNRDKNVAMENRAKLIEIYANPESTLQQHQVVGEVAAIGSNSPVDDEATY